MVRIAIDAVGLQVSHTGDGGFAGQLIHVVHKHLPGPARDYSSHGLAAFHFVGSHYGLKFSGSGVT